MNPSIQLYDTLKGEKQPLPVESGPLGLYVCGVTPYSSCHIGHARTFLTFDLLVRYWRWRGGKVRYVRNITDVDDKIIANADQQGISATALVKQQMEGVRRDFARLGMLEPDAQPRATQSIACMLEMIEDLIERDMAYVASNGDVCYRVAAYADYGKLSRRRIAQQQAGTRIAATASQSKEAAADFVLWKQADEVATRVGAVWDSPWGLGRPGWHIECSAMALRELPYGLHLHGGGVDLKFPHHENEIAQAKGAGKDFAQHWMHVAPVRFKGDKMSKSIGNVMPLCEALDEWGGDGVRAAMIATHYRHPIDMDDTTLPQAVRWWRRLHESVPAVGEASSGKVDASDDELVAASRAKFCAAMDADFNVPLALGVLHDLGRDARAGSVLAAQTLAELLQVLGFGAGETATADCGREEQIQDVINQRGQARDARDFALADSLRQELLEMGVEVRDGRQGQQWRYLPDGAWQ